MTVRCAYVVHVERADGSRYARPCGKCVACIDKLARLRQSRMELQLLQHPDPDNLIFLRLSYDDEHLPLTPTGRATLRYSDVQKFIGLLRKKWAGPFKWAVGCEYGGKPQLGNPPRPHYHLIIDGIPLFRNPWREPNRSRAKRFDREIRHAPGFKDFAHLHGAWQLMLSAWRWRGHVSLKPVDPARHPRYIAAYINKRQKTPDGFYIGEGPGDDRERERFRMGRGMGEAFIPVIADMLRRAKRYPRGWPAPGPEWLDMDLQVQVNGRTIWLDAWMKQKVAAELCPERSEEFKRSFADAAHREAYIERWAGLGFDCLADLASNGPSAEPPSPTFEVLGEPGAFQARPLEILEIETDGIRPRSQAEVDKANRTQWRRSQGLKATAWRKR